MRKRKVLVQLFFMIRIILTIMIFSLLAYSQPLRDINVLKEDQRTLIIEYKPDIQEEFVKSNQGTFFSKFNFYDSQIEYDSTGRANFLRTLILLLPSSAFDVQIMESEFYIKDKTRLLPRPTIRSMEDFGIYETYDEEQYSSIVLPPIRTSVADLAQIAESGFGKLGLLKIRPVQIVDNEKVKIFSRIVIRIDFKESFPVGLTATSLLKGVIPNSNQLKILMKTYGKKAVSESPLATGDIYKIEIQEPGIYKLDYDYFQRLNVANIINDINSIRLYGNGGEPIPDSPDTNLYPRPNNLLEIPRFVYDKNGNGKLEQDDYVLFYGTGTYSWKYQTGNIFRHTINPYSMKNYYFLTFNQGVGKNMDTILGSISAPLTPVNNFLEMKFIEQDKYNLISTGRRWFGKMFYGSDNVDVYTNNLDGFINSMPITYRFSLANRSSTRDMIYVYENNNLIYSYQMNSTSTSISDEAPYASNVSFSLSTTMDIPNNTSVLRIQLAMNNSEAKAWLDWVEILYYRRFQAVGDFLLFNAPDTSGVIQYQVSDISSNVYVFDVTNHNNVKQITQVDYDAVNSICSFQLEQQKGVIRKIVLVGNNGFKIPPLGSRIENSNLHGIQTPIDFVIISPKEFLSEANRLKIHRETKDSLKTVVVDIEHVYNEFAGGLPDPFAIREFLRYIRPKYALLFGAGHYDFRNISTNQRNWIPPCEPEGSFVYTNTFPRDDLYAIFASSESISVAIGRLPARDADEAKIVVDKIIGYETASSYDNWRNTITYVADDRMVSTGEEGSDYTSDSEYLANNYTSNIFEKNKIYIVAYPTVNSIAGRRKPQANKAIVDAFNQGSLLINFIGHGNERLWTHEAIFVKETDFPKLNNKNKLPIVFAATCNYGKYDNYNIISSAEMLLTLKDAGAIATLAAARATYNSSNVALNRSFFSYLLFKNENKEYSPIGWAWLLAKNRNTNLDANKYHLFGDPTVKPLAPINIASADSINGRAPLSSVITLKALERVIIKGTIKDKNEITKNSFSGKGIVRLFDSKRTVSIKDGNYKFTYQVAGSQLYQGEVSIINGAFQAIAPIPKDVTFGTNARISIYAYDEIEDAIGYTENITINGFDTTASIDTIGPRISIYLNDFSFAPGNIVGSNPLLIVRLEDESGINTSNSGIGHRMLAVLNNSESIEISNYYKSDIDVFNAGEVRYQLSDLSEGKYTLSVRAWDIYNNSAEAETFFEVSNSAGLVLHNVFNYPNPFSRSTTFTFQRNSIEPIEVEIKIYSVAGRLLYSIKHTTSDRFVRIPWDGRDKEGDQLANGIYFYKIIAKDLSDGNNAEFIGKLAILK